MKNFLLLILSCIFLNSCNSQSRITNKFKQLPMLSIENENLLPLIDDVVRFYDNIEQKSDSLFITISTLKRSGQENPVLLISSNEHRITIFDGYDNPFGYFYYKNYLFVVYEKESERFFSSTNTQKASDMILISKKNHL